MELDCRTSRFVSSDILLGASVALHLVGAKRLGNALWIGLHRAKRPIRFVAARSFTLYLLHQPALLFVAACFAAWPLGEWRGTVAVAVTLGLIALVALLTEGQPDRLKPIFANAVRAVVVELRRWSKQIEPQVTSSSDA